MKYSISYKDQPQEYRRRQSLQRRKNNPIGYLLSQCKYRAKIRGMPFDITKEDLIIPEVCPVFQIPMFFVEGKRGPNSYSIDRIDNSKGYVKGNVRVISLKANMYKGDLDIETVERLLKYMKGQI